MVGLKYSLEMSEAPISAQWSILGLVPQLVSSLSQTLCLPHLSGSQPSGGGGFLTLHRLKRV